MSDDGGVIYRELDTDGREPALQIAEIVADLEGEDVNDLSSAWDCIDHVLDHVFSNPPSPAAQVQITFSYEGYRITVGQSGRATFVKPG